MNLMEDAAKDDEYSVAWIDCLAKGKNLGRSIYMSGHHASIDELPRRLSENPLAFSNAQPKQVPSWFPSSVLNPLTVKGFNLAYNWQQGRKTRPFLSSLDKFFYPLDSLGQWNRIYGKKGFYQYQCALPENNAHQGLTQVLERLSEAGCGSSPTRHKLEPARSRPWIWTGIDMSRPTIVVRNS